MSIFLETAKEILKREKKPLHYREITRIAIEKGIIKTKGVTPEASMNAIIATDIKKKGMASDFLKIGKGVYSLNENKIDSAFF